MKQFLFFLSLILLLTSCSNSNNTLKEISDFVPSNSAFIIKTNSLQTLESDLKNNDIINKLSKAKFLDSITKNLHLFDSLKVQNEAIICFSKDDDISYITRLSKDFTLDSTTQKATSHLHKTITDSIVVASTSKEIIESISTEKSIDKDFSKLYQTFKKSPLAVFVNQNNTFKITDNLYNNPTFSLKTLSNWMALETDLQQEQIMLNGVSVVTDTLPKLLNIFKNTHSKENKTANVTPQTVDGFVSLSFYDFTTFHQNLNTYNSIKVQDSTQLNLFKSVNEIGLMYKGDDLAIALYTSDIIETKDALLSEQNIADNFRQIDIFNYSKTDLFKTTLNPFANNDVKNYMIIDDVVIFSNSDDFLKDIIVSVQNKSALANSEIYQETLSNLSDESSLLIVPNNKNFKSVWAEQSSESFKEHIKNLSLDGYHFSALQFIQDNGFLHTNAIIRKNQPKAISNSITEQFNIVLDDAILNQPQLVKNHITNQKEIVVQDVKNNLYLISNKGKVLWKKQLNGNILGKIEQIDMYKNGRLQLAFATPNRVYVLDRNGKDVSPFPLKFNDDITQPLSVFDYDKKKNYRLLVTQGKNTLMYDAKGKRVSGFKFKTSNSNISSQPKHMRIGSKDYIVFAAGKKLEILSRTGQTRIKVNQDFNFSDNEIYLYNNKFSFTNIKGELVQVDQNGRVSKQNLMLPENHNLTTTSKTLVALAGNKLTIKSNTIDLDFGNYTKPEIFYLRDKIYVAVTDLQSQKVYLFDSQAKSIDNFPVYGTSTLQLDNMNKDRNLEFVVKGDSNSLILYKIN